ncbi:glycoside hydrolase family 3 protein [Fulvivirga sp. RKSG066]|uniref:glycoside hydrolase family 3 protein n=1 Tax=Fulvivirga aurantia TaxID=2529383 RepID=UPI0012BD5A89|nr:glycoside hydrolase family 3 protein [Fulvivirga aurantia]MTI21224.1 glycoside hydrolase family 3 protein [Fulvivirga aurantia]
MIKTLTVALSLLTTVCYAQTDSLDIKIGQMLLVGMNGQEVDDQLLNNVKKGQVGGVIFFEKNITKTNSFINLKRATWTLQKAAPTPLFVAIDQEGGTVNRLKEKYSFPKSVTAEYLGETNSLDSTKFYAEITASTLSGLGFNVNFAPVVDLSINKDNPVIAKYGRSFSDDPSQVVKHASEVIDAHRAYNVITVLKHFPGHGSSLSDTHLGIADVTDYWQKEELSPYIGLLDAEKVDAVMTAHIVNKQLEPAGLPGTLSRKIMTGILRDSLGHRGVIFSDDMQMHAIEKHFGLENALLLAIDAGVDVLIFSNNIQNSEVRTVDTVHSIIRKLVKEGKLTEQRINESYERILKLKSRL